MKKASRASKCISVLAVMALVFGLMPAPAFAIGEKSDAGSSADAVQRSEEDIESAVSAMISAGDYVEGEVIVCSADSRSDGMDGIAAQSGAVSELLANAESLSSVTAGQYAKAMGQAVAASAESSALAAQSADDAVEVSLVRVNGATTEQLLRDLLSDPRVLSAEPNYVMNLETADESAPANAGSTAGTHPIASEGAAPAELADANLVAAETPRLQSQDEGNGESFDFTEYQWFSDGVNSTIPQYHDATNPGLKAPDWNNPDKTNASGVVCIMDSGVDYTHPDLNNVMYRFSPELQDWLGCGEFGYAPERENVTDPMDGLGHGSHCAGIVAAEWNGFGVSGLANGVKLCAISVARSTSSTNICYSAIIKGYDFMLRAVRAGVDIRAVNRSIMTEPTNNADRAMIQAAGEAGIVTCMASGNENVDLDKAFTGISVNQQSPYILRVDASKLQDDRAWFSNYGAYNTDVFAPGVGILSTIPSNDPSMSRYYPQADNDPIFLKTSFEDALPNVSADSPVTIKSVSRGDIGVDGDSDSLKVSIETSSDSWASFYVDVPVAGVNMKDVQDISIALHAGNVETRVPSLNVLIDDGSEDGTYSANDIFEDMSESSPSAWSFGRLHLADSSKVTQDFKYVKDSQGRDCIRLSVRALINFQDIEADAPASADVYFDQISFGKKDNSGFLPYCYMAGTSMATPCVTACAAIVSSGIEGVNPDVRAASTVRKLKGAVRQAPGYNGYCRQNGQIDLSLLDDPSKFVPVIESAELEGETIAVKGAYFASSGTLLVGGVKARVQSWSTNSITALWPEGVASGLVPVNVKTFKGARSCRAFALAAPEGTTGSAPLYERDLVAPTNPTAESMSATGVPTSLATTEDGTIFGVATDGNENDFLTTRYLMRSNDQGASWTYIKLPQYLKQTRIAAGDGAVFLLGATPIDNPTAVSNWHLYKYSISEDSFELLRTYDNFGEEVSGFGQLAYAGGNLYFVDAYMDTSSGEAQTHMRIRRFDASYVPVDDYLLGKLYKSYAFYNGPKVATVGNTIYICGVGIAREGDDLTTLYGLERVDVLSDTKHSYEDLSSAFTGITSDLLFEDVGISACDQGLFLIGRNINTLLPANANRTDTLFLKNGAKTFEAYPRTLSFAPVSKAVSTCTNGWLYAYGISNDESKPVFGRATQLPAQPVPEPTPQPTPEIGESRTVGNYIYTVQSATTASVKLSAAGKKSLEKATIPAEVKLGEKTFKVTAIDYRGFVKARKLTSVSIGKNVKTIGSKAFMKCAKLERITGGTSVTRIGSRACGICAKLKVFKISSKSLSQIGARAFAGCSKLKVLNIAQTTKLTKKGVKDCLAGSKVETLNVKNTKRAAYEKLFTKKNCGRKVVVK